MNKQTPNDDPLKVFKSARDGARQRGIAWQLTFAEWWAEWSAHWPRRGTVALGLCRDGDAGPYARGNVRVDTIAANNVDAILYGSRPARGKAAKPKPFAGLSPEVQAVVDAGRARILAGIGKP